MEELIDLFFTPQGQEFCVEHNLPSMDTLILFRSMQAACMGFYIEMPVCMKNASRMALFGPSTEAILEYDDVGVRHEVILMHGAKAKIIASGYAIVFVTNAGGSVDKIEKGNAIIFVT
jgi:hypothetical protein